MKITVIAPDKSIVVDGVSHTFHGMEFGDFRVLSWDRSKSAGRLEHHGKPNETISGARGRNLVRPYLAAWQKAQDAILEAEAERDRQRKAREAEQQGREQEAAKAAERRKQEAEERRAQYEHEAPLREAQGLLTQSDHEIIKAMETKLAAEGALPKELVASRQAARAEVKKLRKRAS